MEQKIKAALTELKKMQQNGILFPCPRCGQYRMERRVVLNALSRHADVYVCDVCGRDEAIRDMTGNAISLSDWSFVSSLMERKKNE